VKNGDNRNAFPCRMPVKKHKCNEDAGEELGITDNTVIKKLHK
jgi:hypothetical protein